MRNSEIIMSGPRTHETFQMVLCRLALPECISKGCPISKSIHVMSKAPCVCISVVAFLKCGKWLVYDL